MKRRYFFICYESVGISQTNTLRAKLSANFCQQEAKIAFVCCHQTIVCYRQTMVWSEHTIVWRQQTKGGMGVDIIATNFGREKHSLAFGCTEGRR